MFLGTSACGRTVFSHDLLHSLDCHKNNDVLLSIVDGECMHVAQDKTQKRIELNVCVCVRMCVRAFVCVNVCVSV